ncbi:MAG TPA: ArsB/NhaD family transporter [Kofleriaceae bacterium]|nr:ArsB/NhaD family transporter [Kofleriaceae bacterium]
MTAGEVWDSAARSRHPIYSGVTPEFRHIGVVGSGLAAAFWAGMEQVVAYAALAATVGLAVTRPRLGRYRVTPGAAALAGVLALIAARLLTPHMMLEAARVQWRPLVTLTSIMILTGVVHEVGAFERLAAVIEQRARTGTRSAASAFTLVFALAAATPSLLNNDAAILILTPLVVALTRRLYPRRPEITIAFAFAVFLAPGVAPFIVSNPMNMIVAEYAGLGFNAYAVVMVPLSLVGALLTYGVLRWVYRGLLRSAPAAAPAPRTVFHRHAGERPAVLLMLAVFIAYPIAAALGAEIWTVAAAGALASLTVCRIYDVAPLRKAASHVSLDILVFLWGIFLVVQGLRSVGVVDELRALYAAAPAGSGSQLATIGVASALGSAAIDNHPMSILNMLALDRSHGPAPLLAALIGGDIGPRLLPIGSLAGLLWVDLLRRSGVEIGVGRFMRLGTLVLAPTLAASLAMLWLLR